MNEQAMMEFILGVAIGAAGMIVKNKIIDSDSENSNTTRRELDDLHAENENLYNKNKEQSRRLEDLQIENEKLLKKFRSKDESTDDLKDEVDDLKSDLKKETLKNQELKRKVKELESAYSSLQNDYDQLKK